jgi:hypothetical protein
MRQNATGGRGGGITYFSSVKSGGSDGREFLVKVYPNPSKGPIKVISNTAAKARLMSSLGQVLVEGIFIKANQEIEIQTQVLTPGLYLLQFETDQSQVLVKKIRVD